MNALTTDTQNKIDDKIKELYLEHKNLNSTFTLIVKSYSKRLYLSIFKVLRSHSDTDDVLQETFIKAFSHIDKFKWESSMFSWLYKIASNEAINFIRKNSKNKNLNIDDIYSELCQSIASEEFCESSSEKQIEQAIASLPDRQKQIFTLRHNTSDNNKQIKFSELATITNLSEGAVKSSYQAAKIRLRQILKK